MGKALGQTCQTMLRYLVISMGQLSNDIYILPERPLRYHIMYQNCAFDLAELPNCSSTTIHFHKVFSLACFYLAAELFGIHVRLGHIKLTDMGLAKVTVGK